MKKDKYKNSRMKQSKFKKDQDRSIELEKEQK